MGKKRDVGQISQRFVNLDRMLYSHRGSNPGPFAGILWSERHTTRPWKLPCLMSYLCILIVYIYSCRTHITNSSHRVKFASQYFMTAYVQGTSFFGHMFLLRVAIASKEEPKVATLKDSRLKSYSLTSNNPDLRWMFLMYFPRTLCSVHHSREQSTGRNDWLALPVSQMAVHTLF